PPAAGMAMFDRRLLAYFDGGGLAGETTLQDRITDYQRDLAEIEHALLKYQAVVGGSRARVRARARDEWIAKHQSRRTCTATSLRRRATEPTSRPRPGGAGLRGTPAEALAARGAPPRTHTCSARASLRPSPDASQGSRRSSQLLPQDAAGQDRERCRSGCP
ncbi:unnamed protein product, partial [Prorocentrum cordatum]